MKYTKPPGGSKDYKLTKHLILSSGKVKKKYKRLKSCTPKVRSGFSKAFREISGPIVISDSDESKLQSSADDSSVFFVSEDPSPLTPKPAKRQAINFLMRSSSKVKKRYRTISHTRPKAYRDWSFGENSNSSAFTSGTRLAPKTKGIAEKRIILIDGSNVALGYSAAEKGELYHKAEGDFSARGLKIALDYFLDRGFQVKAIVPEFRIKHGRSSDANLMKRLNYRGLLTLTPSGSYDDLQLLMIAKRLDAAVVSNDFFRDIWKSHEHYREIIDRRQIRFTWAFGEFFLPEDPYGRRGPKLEDILYK